MLVQPITSAFPRVRHWWVSALATLSSINDKLGIYFDLADNMVPSGFVGVEKGTGTGSNSNGFFDISLGVNINISKTKTFKKVEASY